MDMKKILQTLYVLNEGTMAAATKHSTGPKFVGKAGPFDTAAQAKKKLVGDSVIPGLAKQAKQDTVKNKLSKEFAQFKETRDEELDRKFNTPAELKKDKDYRDYRKGIEQSRKEVPTTYHDDGTPMDIKSTRNTVEKHTPKKNEFDIKETELDEFAPPVAEAGEINRPDTITVDVPLLIRLLEYAREDAQSDIDLHDVAERLINLSEGGRTLTMDDYADICQTENIEESASGTDGIVSAICRRIMHLNKDALLKYGPQAVLDAAQEEAEWIGDVDELGSSDISIAVSNVLNALERNHRPLGEEQINELGAANPNVPPQGSTATAPQNTNQPATQATPQQQQQANDLIQTNKTLQTLKPNLQQAAGGNPVDVNKLTQSLGKVDADPKAQQTGQDLTTLSKMAPGVADALKDPNASNLLKQAIQKGQTAAQVQAQKAQNQQSQ